MSVDLKCLWKLDRDVTSVERERLYILAEAAGYCVHNRHNEGDTHMRFPSVCAIHWNGWEICACTTIIEREVVYTYDQIMEALQEMIRNNPYVYEEDKHNS